MAGPSQLFLERTDCVRKIVRSISLLREDRIRGNDFLSHENSISHYLTRLEEINELLEFGEFENIPEQLQEKIDLATSAELEISFNFLVMDELVALKKMIPQEEPATLYKASVNEDKVDFLQPSDFADTTVVLNSSQCFVGIERVEDDPPGGDVFEKNCLNSSLSTTLGDPKREVFSKFQPRLREGRIPSSFGDFQDLKSPTGMTNAFPSVFLGLNLQTIGRYWLL